MNIDRISLKNKMPKQEHLRHNVFEKLSKNTQKKKMNKITTK